MQKKSKRTLHVNRIATTQSEKHFLEICVHYSIGGHNFFSGEPTPQGFYLSVQPIEVGDGFTTFIGFTGIKSMLEPAKRFSAKRLNELAESTEHQPLLDELINRVCTKQGITLKTSEAA